MCQDNQWILFGCVTSWSPSWKSTLQTLGDEPGLSKEVKILNRKPLLTRWTRDIIRGRPETCRSNHPRNRSIQFDIFENLHAPKRATRKCDAKQTTLWRRQLGKLKMKDHPLIGIFLSPAETTRKRALAATANFLAIDRGDIVYCAIELRRHMATPTTEDWEKVVRLVEVFAKQTQESVLLKKKKIQETPHQLETYSDPDWAGCK